LFCGIDLSRKPGGSDAFDAFQAFEALEAFDTSDAKRAAAATAAVAEQDVTHTGCGKGLQSHSQ
jgi:hypothetical protein